MHTQGRLSFRFRHADAHVRTTAYTRAAPRPPPLRQVVPRLGRIPQRCLVLAGGGDVLLRSAEEAERLEERLQRGFKKVRVGGYIHD